MRAVRREDPDAFRTGSVDITLRIHLQTIGNALFFRAGEIVEDAAVGNRAVGSHVVAHPEPLLLIGIRDVECLLVGRQRDPVGTGEVLDDGLQPAVSVQEDAVERQFLGGIVILLEQSVGRIGEIERSVRTVDQIVRAVEPVALEFLQPVFRSKEGVKIES